jgi:hypothetical protein
MREAQRQAAAEAQARQERIEREAAAWRALRPHLHFDNERTLFVQSCHYAMAVAIAEGRAEPEGAI